MEEETKQTEENLPVGKQIARIFWNALYSLFLLLIEQVMAMAVSMYSSIVLTAAVYFVLKGFFEVDWFVLWIILSSLRLGKTYYS